MKDNRLRELEGGSVLESAACLIGHGPSLAELVAEGEDGPLALLLDAIDGVRGTEGWLHLEVVGNPTGPGCDAVEQVVSQRRSRGAAHIVRGEVWDDRGSPAWRVTALLPASRLVACQRVLFRLGAGRVVGLAPLILFNRDAASSFNTLSDTRFAIAASVARLRPPLR